MTQWGAIRAAFAEVVFLPVEGGVIGTVGSQSLAQWGAIRAAFAEVIFLLVEGGVVGTIGSQGVQYLANGCMAGLSLWSSLFTGWQRVGIGSQDGKGKTED